MASRGIRCFDVAGFFTPGREGELKELNLILKAPRETENNFLVRAALRRSALVTEKYILPPRAKDVSKC